MRLWTLHPKYLDPQGLVALWREALLARAVLRGETRGYRHHPQLLRFQAHPAPRSAINAYLRSVLAEADQRGYSFDRRKVGPIRTAARIASASGQLEYEWRHLMGKLRLRSPLLYRKWREVDAPEPHPLFRIRRGRWNRGSGRMEMSRFGIPWREYPRPWKLVTLAIGVALLIVGSFYYEAPDWDIPISLIMAGLAYLSAPWSLRVIMERRWRLWPAMLFATWFTVDGCYWIYWHFKNPAALDLMREANFPASLSLYGMCGVLWLYRGSLRELFAETAGLLRR